MNIRPFGCGGLRHTALIMKLNQWFMSQQENNAGKAQNSMTFVPLLGFWFVSMILGDVAITREMQSDKSQFGKRVLDECIYTG